MDNRPIGLLDTGVGGLALARELQRQLPHEQIIFLADTAGAPYGGHSRELIQRRALAGLHFLREQGAKLLVCACGSISAALTEQDVRSVGAPFLSLLLPCAQQACATSVNGVIGIIGSPAAVRSSAFAKTIRNIRTEARVVGKSSPLLAPLVEAGHTAPSDRLLQMVLSESLNPLLDEGIDTLMLASAHYSPLFTAISELTGYRINLVEAASVMTAYVDRYLLENSLHGSPEATGKTVWYVSDGPELFREAIKRCYGKEFTEPVELILLDGSHAKPTKPL